MRGDTRGFMGNSWHNEPMPANAWGNYSDGFVTQSQPAFSQFMGRDNGPMMNYGQVRDESHPGIFAHPRSAFEHIAYNGQQYDDPFAGEQQPMHDHISTFGASHAQQINQSQMPMNDARMYEDATVPNEEEEARMFASAFG